MDAKKLEIHVVDTGRDLVFRRWALMCSSVEDIVNDTDAATR